MNSHVRKWGNSPAIRIPLTVLEEARLSVDQPVDIRQEQGRIIIEASSRPRRYDLSELMAGVTPENLHPEVEWGAPVGAERIDD
jgi:antitoxin MazE